MLPYWNKFNRFLVSFLPRWTALVRQWGFLSTWGRHWLRRANDTRGGLIRTQVRLHALNLPPCEWAAVQSRSSSLFVCGGDRLIPAPVYKHTTQHQLSWLVPQCNSWIKVNEPPQPYCCYYGLAVVKRELFGGCALHDCQTCFAGDGYRGPQL